MLDLLLSIYKISYKVKIKIKSLIEIWDEFEGNDEKEYEFYQWANNVLKCEQGIDDETITDEFESFYCRLFSR